MSLFAVWLLCVLPCDFLSKLSIAHSTVPQGGFANIKDRCKAAGWPSLSLIRLQKVWKQNYVIKQWMEPVPFYFVDDGFGKAMPRDSNAEPAMSRHAANDRGDLLLIFCNVCVGHGGFLKYLGLIDCQCLGPRPPASFSH